MKSVARTLKDLIEALRQPRLRPVPVPVRAKDEARITKEDKRLIMEHINELFGIEERPLWKTPVAAEPITEEDKRIIMEHIDELFATGGGQSGQKSS